ncbi:MAG: c-type cytochrome [Halobacteriovoraceae bacterium]|jgi:cytochrome c oxidase cbb3-type subunit 3|nr:c-type cytochrome [Halobacteriovoraceae bacterium]
MNDQSKVTEAQNVILNESEQKLLLDHNYDGIEEFDYPLPQWWVWTFIGGAVFAVLYIYFYNFAGAPSLEEEFKREMAKIETVRKEQRKLTGNFDLADFQNWQKGENVPQMAATVYEENCLSCHEEGGKGDIGPNLTDSYWVNFEKDPEPVDFYAFIRVGNEDNGMPAWADMLSKEELYAAVHFVLNLKGKNIPGKEPQGKKY